MEMNRHKIEVTDDTAADRYRATTGLAQALRRTDNRDTRRHGRKNRGLK